MSTIVSRAEMTIRAYGAQAYYAMESPKCRVHIGWNARHKGLRIDNGDEILARRQRDVS